MKRVVISQPMYFPWVGFLAQMALADVMIWLDDVHFSTGSFTNRIQVKTPRGRTWMSIPLVGKGHGLAIRDLATTELEISAAHRALLRNSLKDAPEKGEMLDVFNTAWHPGAPLVETLIRSAEALADAIGLPPRSTLRASELGVEGSGSSRVLELVRAVGGQQYITGHGARSYLNHEAFDAAGVDVQYMDYAPRPWKQDHGAFTPYVTALDLIAQVPAQARADYLAPRTLGWQSFLKQE
jgi:hypothetical protein